VRAHPFGGGAQEAVSCLLGQAPGVGDFDHPPSVILGSTWAQAQHQQRDRVHREVKSANVDSRQQWRDFSESSYPR
jgi:hypothetical protein